MVKKIKQAGRELWQCSSCGFGYADEKTAKECEAFCNKYGGCSREITKKAIWRPK